MKVLGINAVYHETAAALLVDGRLVAAAEEERFSRRKHGKPAVVDNPDSLPEAAIGWCLTEGGIRGEELDAVAYSFSPSWRHQCFVPDTYGRTGDWGSVDGEATFSAHLEQVPNAAEALLGTAVHAIEVDDDVIYRPGRTSANGVALHFIPHHLAHAASAYHASGWTSAAVLVLDGIGEADTGLLAHAQGTFIEALDAPAFPDSLGFLWEKVCTFLGFSEYDACKVMGMAAYGDANPQRYALAELADVDDEGRLHCAADVLRFRQRELDAIAKHLGPPRMAGSALEKRHFDIAAALQELTELAVLGSARRLSRLTGERRLAYAGGLALNCVANRHLLNAGLFKEVFVPSAPHDAGTAAGAAMHVHVALTGAPPRPCGDALVGPEYDDMQIEAALTRGGLVYRCEPDIADSVAQLLAGGFVVAWFQGRMEFGPRALGNRSLLADPRRDGMRERLNALVKRREAFRPFAPSVLAEWAESWFDIGESESILHELMLVTCPVLSERRERIPAVLHVDGTARVQLVRREGNPRFYSLIERFYALTDVPLILNTSFNDQEPIVCSPADAVRTFLKSSIDALAIGDFLVTDRHNVGGVRR